MKKCYKCGGVKELREFNQDGRTNDGYQSKCIVCQIKCTQCSETDPAKFHIAPGTSSGLGSQCRACRKKFRQTPHGKMMRRAKVLRLHSFNQMQWDNMWVNQGFGCAICGTDTPGGNGSFAVDHDHACCPPGGSCGKCVRGLLCHKCNTGIGMLGDDPLLLYVAMRYLEAHKLTALKNTLERV